MGICDNCMGSGLIPSEKPTRINTDNYPHIAIIGGGIS